MSGYHNGHYGGTTSPYGNRNENNGNGNPNAYYANSNYGYGEEMVEFDVLNHGHGHGHDAAYMNSMNMNNNYDPNERVMGRSPPKPIRPGLQPVEDFASPVGSPLGTPGGQPGWPLPARSRHDRHVDSFASVSSTPAGSRSATPAFVCPFLKPRKKRILMLTDSAVSK